MEAKELIKKNLGIRCSEIVTDKEIKFLEGYVWETSLRTWKEWVRVKKKDIGFRVGHIRMDLIDMSTQDTLETVTIDKNYFYNILRGTE